MLTHFSAMLIFALCVSVVFGITQRSRAEDDDPLRRVLLRALGGRDHRRQLGDVGHQALAAFVH